jgi:undecaprenol kinase
MKKKSDNWRDTFKHAVDGCIWAFSTQKNFKVHFSLSGLVILLGLWLQISFERWLLIILAISWGLTIEMANTAIEKAVDLVTQEFNLKAKIVKDVAAGMMLLLSLGLAALGFLILLPPLWQKVTG